MAPYGMYPSPMNGYYQSYLQQSVPQPYSYNQPATQDFVQSQANYSNLLDGNRDLANLITSGTAQAVAATNHKFPLLLTEIARKHFTDGVIPSDFDYEVITDNTEHFAIHSYCCDVEKIKVV